jgi:hypothetical protein
MVKTLVATALLVVCLSGCRNSEPNKAAGFTVVNVNDLGEQFSKDKEALRAKYEGKEVVVMGYAMKDFETQFYGAETQDLRLVGDVSNPNHATANCTVRKADADKFAGVKEGALIAVKGVMHVKEFGMEMEPCNREFRAEK